ncbi:MAG: hypothetical protein HOL37_00400 [Rhodospirillaceae bacterium]|jgi:hypothetical protein|nr:hypothetical protein [Rhodospirillaceae bacterium]MBT5307772.1 hypothetical protein [Rhodospirillaceae bacterium]MBT7354876.1 hypothetical protein [Rhodospirillaceae bacterium]
MKTAQHMIDRYGDDACRQVDVRIEELSKSGDGYDEAHATWCQVREYIITLNSNSTKKTV